jgi:NADH-quinone oxidoreductase subunit C
MNRDTVQDLIAKKLPGLIVSAEAMKNDDFMLVVHAKHLVTVVGTLKNDPDLGFSTLMNHLGVDYGDRMAVIYNLYSPSLRMKITVKVYLDRNNAEVDSLARAFLGIEWYERENFDLLGIRYIGNGNLKRLLLPDDWEGHPLRKDYTYPAAYNGIETGRTDLLDEAERRTTSV